MSEESSLNIFLDKSLSEKNDQDNYPQSFQSNIFQSSTQKLFSFEEMKRCFPYFFTQKDEKEEEGEWEKVFNSYSNSNSNKAENKSTCALVDKSEKSSKIFSSSIDEIYNKNIFKTKHYRKRGRKITERENRKYHSGKDYDNMKRNIQVKFFTFLINLANDAIVCFLGNKSKQKFLKINYQLKQKITENYLQNLKNVSYSDILKMEISIKYRKFEKNNNEKTLQEVCEKNDDLKSFFSQNYMYIFNNYFFNNKKELKEIWFKGKKICISSKTKNLYHLLKNEEKKKEILSTINKVYFNEKDENKIFKTNLIELDENEK